MKPSTTTYYQGYVAGLKWALRAVNTRLRAIDQDAEPDRHADLAELYDEILAREGELSNSLDQATDEAEEED